MIAVDTFIRRELCRRERDERARAPRREMTRKARMQLAAFWAARSSGMRAQPAKSAPALQVVARRERWVGPILSLSESERRERAAMIEHDRAVVRAHYEALGRPIPSNLRLADGSRP